MSSGWQEIQRQAPKRKHCRDIEERKLCRVELGEMEWKREVAQAKLVDFGGRLRGIERRRTYRRSIAEGLNVLLQGKS